MIMTMAMQLMVYGADDGGQYSHVGNDGPSGVCENVEVS